ncbi:MAG: T9SS type A sorting domain-containing protein [Emticicia sp.]
MFDNIGRVIAVPVDGEFDAGKHEVVVDTSGFNSGMYFARLQNGQIQQVRRMVK